MIQRIQSLFLILIAILGIAIFFFPLVHFSVVSYTFDLFITGIKNLDTANPFSFSINMVFHLIILIALIITAIGTIFLYKRRDLQIKLCKFGMMLNIVFVFLIYMFADSIKSKFVAKVVMVPEFVMVNFKVGSFLPLIMLVLFFLAIRFIKKDDELIKSADRLR